jgi:60 kDa SS-A/Ro ribonucleoprotein
MMRNLPKMSTVGLFEGYDSSQSISAVVSRLTNAESLKAARIHPLKVLVALYVYSSGHGQKGSMSWAPVPSIVNALRAAFKLAFGAVQPSGKRILLALDVSGSMDQPMSGTPLSCRDGAAAMALITKNVESQVTCLAFTNTLVPFPIRADENVDDVSRRMMHMPFGGTDCAQPMLWAQKHRAEVDCFIVFTDNETWAGAVHPFEALKSYRKSSGITDAKMAVVGMSSNGFSIADPDDGGMMDFVGFDTATPDVIGMFARGEI